MKSEDLEARITALMERCRDLHEDVDLQSVKDWKKSTGGRAVGSLPIYVPDEILHAAGILPVGLIGGGDRVDVIRGDAYFQSYICRLPRSMVELGLSERLDVLDGVLFPAICDVIRNLSGIWTMLFPDQFVRFVDFPQNFDPEIGGSFYRGELQRLADDMATLSGTEITTAALNEAITLYDINRKLILKLHDARQETPEKVSTYELYLVQRAGQMLPVTEHNQMLQEYLDLATSRSAGPIDNARILIIGAFCEQPPLPLIRSLELAGCFIVEDDMLMGNRLLGEVGTGEDPMSRLSTAYFSPQRPCASVYDEHGERMTNLIDRVHRLRADGVLFASPSFCDPALLDRPIYQKALEEARIPFTMLKYAENTRQLSAIREQVGTFAESIRLWGDAPASPAA